MHFDVWFSERGCTRAARSERAVERLRAQGHVFDDGRRGVGAHHRLRRRQRPRDLAHRRQPTYFAADAAYYLTRATAASTHKIYLLGADHHGYVHRLKALAGVRRRRPGAATSRC